LLNLEVSVNLLPFTEYERLWESELKTYQDGHPSS